MFSTSGSNSLSWSNIKAVIEDYTNPFVPLYLADLVPEDNHVRNYSLRQIFPILVLLWCLFLPSWRAAIQVVTFQLALS